MSKVVTMGEIMLRLSTPGYERFVQAESFDAIYGGGEANVAVSLANYGHESYFVTKLPKHEIGQSAVNELRRYGVNTDYIVRGGERVGIYFSETGASMRPSKVIYDRSNSSIAEADVEEFDFDKIFKDAKWFHISGITPAISKKGAELTKAAMISAKKNGVTVSIDLNYRKKLWTPEEAQAVMKDLMQYVDVCIGNEEDASLCLGFTPKGLDVTSGKLDVSGYEQIFKEMKEEFGFKVVASTLRESYSASDNGWSACIYDGKEFYHSRKYDVRITDRVGGGDSFASGLITGLLEGKSSKDALEFAVAASALKHTVKGDFNLMSKEEVQTLVDGDASGRVQR
ncbi:sugar kinase [Peptoniphilus stercorisuis]|uniref:2-dehydro-3-deoxygluconokinase n=1 Tax=Peptoniphilus stercorisuis TaxID=1436965 RepID=A0ABS4KBA2_9FIRM|nr:sugar kinase [Peptoniphilus stercorisuis]MBP2025057.1 2-dehydro-3-deoxygluconokinase [Peptoniphilus stercorisuis]